MRGLTLFVRPARLIASLLLLVSLWGVPHRQLDDAACLPVSDGEHDASKHAFAPLDAAPHEEHCAVCHWMRALKPDFEPVARVGAPLNASGALVPSAAVALRAPSGAQLPARAPPAA